MFDLADVLKGVPNLGTSKKQLEYIKRELIDPDPNNFYSLTGIEELAANIQLCGLQQPILVRPIDGDGGDWHTGRHLYRGKQRVQTIQR